jgi:hypothetical protein
MLEEQPREQVTEFSTSIWSILWPMSTEYRVKTAGSQFIVIDPWGEQVSAYSTGKEKH